LSFIDDPTRAERDELIQVERDVNSNESFLEYLIDVQRQYGISAYFL